MRRLVIIWFVNAKRLMERAYNFFANANKSFVIFPFTVFLIFGKIRQPSPDSIIKQK